MSRDTDTAEVVVFPPVLLGGTMVLGFLLDRIHPIPLLPESRAAVVAVVLFLVGATLGGFAQSALRRAGTSIRPDRPTLALVTSGPYGRTRNPLYVAALLVYLGVGFFINGLAPFLLFIPLAFLLHWGVVLREERYLASRFGEAYRAYQARVRRWL